MDSPKVAEPGHYKVPAKKVRQPRVKSPEELAAEQKEKERREAIFGFGDITTTFAINDIAVYGFAYYDPRKGIWNCYAGSFQFLFGVYSCLTTLFDEDRDADPNIDILFWAFFTLDEHHKPTAIIPHASLSMEQNNTLKGYKIQHGCTYRDLIGMLSPSTIYPPRLKFEY